MLFSALKGKQGWWLSCRF